MPTTLAAATPFPIPSDGDNPVLLSRQWLTNVMRTESGAEQRAALRAIPRRTLRYTALFESAALAAQFKALWASAPERLRFTVPIWPRYAVPTGFPDASTIDGDFTDRGFVVGEHAAMLWQSEPWQSERLFELLDVETVADGQLTLSTPIAGTYTLGAARVIPVMTAWLEPPTLEQLAIDAERVPVAFTEEIPGIAGIDPDVGGAETPVAATITHEIIFMSYPVGGPFKSGAARVTVFDAAGIPIPRAPLSWTVTPGSGTAYVITFPGDGNIIAADFQGNAFAGVGIVVESGSASHSFGIG